MRTLTTLHGSGNNPSLCTVERLEYSHRNTDNLNSDIRTENCFGEHSEDMARVARQVHLMGILEFHLDDFRLCKFYLSKLFLYACIILLNSKSKVIMAMKGYLMAALNVYFIGLWKE